MQEPLAILVGVILPTFESVESFTPEELLRFVEDEEARGSLYHYELLDGRIHMTPPAGGTHSVAQGNLFGALHRFVTDAKLGRVYGSSAGYRLPTNDVVEPDIAFVSNERHAGMPPIQPGKWLVVVPDLVMEVLSPKHEKTDREKKRAIYERNGVREYWIVDPAERSVQLLVLAGASYGERRVDDIVKSSVLAGFQVAVADIFAD